MTYVIIYAIALLFLTCFVSPLGAIILQAACRFFPRNNEQGIAIVDGEDEPFETASSNSVARAEFDQENPYATLSATPATAFTSNSRGVPILHDAVIIFVVSSLSFSLSTVVVLFTMESMLRNYPYFLFYLAIFLIYIASCVVKSFMLAKYTQRTIPSVVGPIIIDQVSWLGIGAALFIFFGVICSF
jgi:hypothetical protein